jgi:hypothetical protein
MLLISLMQLAGDKHSSHLQTSANRTKPGPSFQLYKWTFASCTILVFSVKLANLKLKTQPKQLLGALPLVIALPALAYISCRQ